MKRRGLRKAPLLVLPVQAAMRCSSASSEPRLTASGPASSPRLTALTRTSLWAGSTWSTRIRGSKSDSIWPSSLSFRSRRLTPFLLTLCAVCDSRLGSGRDTGYMQYLKFLLKLDAGLPGLLCPIQVFSKSKPVKHNSKSKKYHSIHRI